MMWGWQCMCGKRDYMENLCTSLFCYVPKPALKNKVKKKNTGMEEHEGMGEIDGPHNNGCCMT